MTVLFGDQPFLISKLTAYALFDFTRTWNSLTPVEERWQYPGVGHVSSLYGLRTLDRSTRSYPGIVQDIIRTLPSNLNSRDFSGRSGHNWNIWKFSPR